MAKIVVVGGGSAGAVIAARLIEGGTDDVLLLEAGPDYGRFADGAWPPEICDAGMIATTHDWGYESGPVVGRPPWIYERARIMGGCSAHNGAIAAVGHFSDYDRWELPLWHSEKLRPYFDLALDKMRVRTYSDEEASPFHRRCLDAARSAGWAMATDLCDLDANESFGLESVNVVDGVRWNTAFAYLDPVRHHERLTIIDQIRIDRFDSLAGVTRLVGERAGEQLTIEGDLFVLCAGVYGTPSILQRSGIGDPVALRSAGIEPAHELSAVGANLHDHPMINAGREFGVELREWLETASASGFVPEEQTLGKACSSLSDGVFDLHLFPVGASTQTVLTDGRALVEVACVNPLSRGSLHVAGPDPDAAPMIDHRYLSDPDGHDLATLRDGLVMAEELLGQPALRSVLIDEPARDLSDEAIRHDVQHYYHPVGTAAMGVDPASSVVDERGRVHGLDGIMVADASAMPRIPRANTNIPAIMMAERLGGLMLDD